MSLNTNEIYPGAVLIWQVDIIDVQQGTSIWNSSNLVSGAIGVGGPPRPGAPLTVQLYTTHDGLNPVTVQRGIGRLVGAAGGGQTHVASYPVPAQESAFPGGAGTASPIMVGEPLVLRAQVLVPGTVVSVLVCAIVVDTVDYPEG